MTAEERYKITSEEYADLLVEYSQNLRVFDTYPNASIHIMNERFAIVYVPVTQVTGQNNILQNYTVLPFGFGILTEQSLVASGILRLRRLPALDLRGQGVVVGIIDTGIDYTNPAFQYADGTTRIAALWDQTIDSDRYPEKQLYGTVYSSEDINRALSSENPLEVVPSVDEIGHGTMMAGIAAGTENEENDFSGVAPEAEFIIVKLKQMKQYLREILVIPPDVPAYQENDIMWALTYVIDTARSLGRPVAICIGLGTSMGSHDGRGGLESMLSISADFPGVTATVAAGNEGNTRKHFYGEIEPGEETMTVELNVGETTTGFLMEIWGNAPNTYSVDILSPTSEYIPRIAESLRVNREVAFVFEQTVIQIDYQMVEPVSGDQLILLRFRNPTPGIWRFQVYTRGDLIGAFHIWLPISNFIPEDTYFIQSNPYTTITNPGNALAPITVTAYNPENNNLYQAASRGFSRIGTIKPELAAPGVNILAPDLNHGFIQTSGTSAAAAHTTGITALMLEWGIVRGNYPGIDTIEIKQFLIRGARRNPNSTYPNRDWGYGILNIYNVFDVLRNV